jgi:hypothetical protein
MSEDHRASIGASVQRLALAFDPYGWDDARLGVYVDLLADLDPRAVDRAVDRLARTATKMPVPSVVCREVLRERHGELPSALDAYGEVMREVARVGRYGQPELSALTRGSVDAIGGWRHVCDSTMPDATRAAFVKAYDAYAERALREVLIAPELRPALDAFVLHLPEGPIEIRSRTLALVATLDGRTDAEWHALPEHLRPGPDDPEQPKEEP